MHLLKHVMILAAIAFVGACASQSVEERLAKEKPDVKKAGCVQSTASRIKTRQECSSASGRSHTREELDETGGVTMEEKLRVLDPTF